MKINWRKIHWAKNSFAALFASCEKHGYHLHSVDNPENDITCFSLNSINEAHFRDEIQQAHCITIVGGPHASACPQEVVQYADYCIVGEGEYTLPALLHHIEHETGMVPPGVATKDLYKPVNHCAWLGYYPPFSGVKGYIEISRGCPHSCAYCQTPRLFGRSMRHRPIDQIVRYALTYRDVRFISPNALAYGSDGITPRFEKVERLLKKLHSNNIYFGTFPSEVRPEFITDESLRLIDTYCANRRLHFGAQSGSDQVLGALGRGHTTEDVIKAVELCSEHDIIPIVDVIVGFPFETDEDQRATLDLVSTVVKYGKVHAHYFMPLPGTPLAKTAPRDLLAETHKKLGQLSLNGKVTGSWMDPQIRFFRENKK